MLIIISRSRSLVYEVLEGNKDFTRSWYRGFMCYILDLFFIFFKFWNLSKNLKLISLVEDI